MTQIHLSDHFTYKKILRFTLMPILMMVFTSIYWIVDGFFISNYASSSSFAGVNLIFPIVNIVACIGFMFGTGGAALVSKFLGEGNKEKANRTFSLITYTTLVIGIALSIPFFFLIRPIAQGFAALQSVSATEDMIDAAEIYGKIMVAGVTLFMLQGYFHSFFSVNETSYLGFVFSLASGLVNAFLDYILVGVCQLDVVGAASASLCGMFVSTIGPWLYFSLRKKNLIRLGKTSIDFKSIFQSIYNGSSEFVSNISSSAVSIIFNIQLLRLVGEDGVSAYGIIGYVCFIFFAVFIGFSVGISPVIAYNYGAQNKEELTNVFKRSLNLIAIIGLAMGLLSLALAEPLTLIFAKNYPSLMALGLRAMRIYSAVYFLAGFSVFGSAFFTALNNGLMSATVSFFRTFVCHTICVIIFPLFMGVDGVWVSMVAADVLSLTLTFVLLSLNSKKYGYSLRKKKEQISCS